MGEEADRIRAPGLEDETSPPGDSAGEKTAGADPENVETEQCRFDPETVKKAARAGLEFIGKYWARSNREPRLAFTPDELESGSVIWADVFEAWFPDWIIPPKWLAAFSAGIWTWTCYKAREPIFEEAAKRQRDARAEFARLQQEEKERAAAGGPGAAPQEGEEDEPEEDGGEG